MDQEIIRFSVIMPLYNKAAYVEKAIRSVLGQTYPHYELIVVNDGSKDDSAVIAEELLKEVPNARLINQDNAGVAVARNNGVAQAKGDYVCFLDADDWWDVSFLQEMQQFIKGYPEAGIWGTNYWYVKNKEYRKVNIDIQTGYINYFTEYAKTLIQVLWTGSVCVMKSIYIELEGFKPYLSMGEDFDLWLRISLKYKVAYLNKQLSYYNFDVDNSRAIAKLHEPQKNVLWHLDDIYKISAGNNDLRYLIDKLRIAGLFNYYLSNEYHIIAKQELAKIDWSNQPNSIKKQYARPVWFLRARRYLFSILSLVKQKLIRLLVKY